MQTGKAQLAPLILLHPPESSFWTGLVEFLTKTLIPSGLISPGDLSLLSIHDSVEEATSELVSFYSNYSSMRWVGNELVLRVQHLPSASALRALNAQFSHLSTTGTITPTEPSVQEQHENDSLDLQRLKLAFNKTDLGGLRRLIDAVNGSSRKPLNPST
jgi:hypothetical protein